MSVGNARLRRVSREYSSVGMLCSTQITGNRLRVTARATSAQRFASVMCAHSRSGGRRRMIAITFGSAVMNVRARIVSTLTSAGSGSDRPFSANVINVRR
jgi:hypothetical protein